jgi:hypothetical protein
MRQAPRHRACILTAALLAHATLCPAWLDNNLQCVDLRGMSGDLPLSVNSTTQILWQTETWEHPTWQNPSWPAGGGDTVGFPCVVKNDREPGADGKYYLYYSHHDPRSSIGVAVADSIIGPYSKAMSVPGRSDNIVVPAFHAARSNPDDPDHTASPWVVWNEDEQHWFVYFHYFNHIRTTVPGFQLTAVATTPSLASNDWTIWTNASSGTTPQYVPVLPTTSDSWISEASSYNTVHVLPDDTWLAFLRGTSTIAGDPTRLGFASSADGRTWSYFTENPVIHQNDGGGGRAGVYRPGFIGFLGPNGSGSNEYLVAWQESHYFDGDARLIYGTTTDFKSVTRDPRGHVTWAGSDGPIGAWREGDKLYLFSGKVLHIMALPLIAADHDSDGNGLYDLWEYEHFNGLGTDPDANADGDEATNRQEHDNGTDPNDPADYVSPADATMIFGAIGDDGSGPPGAFDGSITPTASQTVGGVRTPDRAINGSGIVLSGGDPTDPNNYAHTFGTNAFGDDFNFLADINGTEGNWFKVDLGRTYTLKDACLFNFNPDASEGGLNNEDRGVATANIWYLDAAGDPNANDDGNDSAFISTAWTQLGSTTNFTIAPTGDVNQTVPDVIDFGDVPARFVALDILTNHGDPGFVGFGEIQFFAVPIPDPDVTLAVIEDTLGATFDSVSNATYRLQSTPDLVSSNFTDTGAIAIGNGAAITMFDPTGTSTSKNYRVVPE